MSVKRYRVNISGKDDTIAELTILHPAIAENAEDNDEILFPEQLSGNDEVLLDEAKLDVFRPSDLLKLTFYFKGLKLRRKSVFNSQFVVDRDEAEDTDKYIKVVLPPQYLAETIYQSLDLDKPLDIPVSQAKLVGNSQIVFDVSQDSRVKGGGLDFKLNNLLEDSWNRWSIVVNKRVSIIQDSVDDQLEKHLGIDSEDSLQTAVDKIKKFHDESAFSTAWETSLEIIPSLYFSPLSFQTNIKRKLWQFNPGLEDEKGAKYRLKPVFWSVKYASSISAYKSDFIEYNDKFFGKKNGVDSTLLPLQRDDHWNLHVLTSMCGIPALLREERLSQVVSDSKTGDQSVKSKQRELSEKMMNLPSSMVVSPNSKKEYKYLRTLDHYLHIKEQGSLSDIDFSCDEEVPGEVERNHGVIRSKLADKVQLTLTPIGTSFRFDYKAEPPNVADTNICDGIEIAKIDKLNLERILLEIGFGRLVKVISQKKGYLLPFGVRVSYLQIITREAHAVSDKRAHDLSLPVKRHFILVRNPIKDFPIIYQPYQSRGCPLGRFEMKTLVTGELIPPCVHEQGGVEVGFGGKLIASDFENSIIGSKIQREDAFFPKLLNISEDETLIGSKKRIESDQIFHWTSSELETEANCPMLFVSNNIVSSPDLLKNVVQYYNTLSTTPGKQGTTDSEKWHHLRTAQFNGARFAYAPSEDGNTSFDTRSWLLSIQGRHSKGREENGEATIRENFFMDRFLEGADHPACFPLVEMASINLQQVAAVLGEPQKVASAKFHNIYLDHGFSEEKNKGEIYLHFVGPKVIEFNSSKKTNTVGAAASPRSNIGGLSRKTGVVGAKLKKEEASSLSTKGALIQSSEYDLDYQAEGGFDPKRFFNEESKLLGILPLGELVGGTDLKLSSNAPKILESYVYGVVSDSANATERELVKRLKKIAVGDKGDSGLLKGISDGLASFKIGFINRMPDGYKLEDLYPDLHDSIDSVKSSLEDARVVFNNQESEPTLQSISEELKHLIQETKLLIRVLNAIVQNPIPKPISDFMEQVASIISALNSFLIEPEKHFQKMLRNELEDYLERFCKQLDVNNKEKLLKNLLGQDYWTGEKCEDVVNRIVSNPNSLKSGLFYQQFAEPIYLLLKNPKQEAETFLQQLFDAFFRHLSMVLVNEISSGVDHWCNQTVLSDNHLVKVLDSVFDVADQALGEPVQPFYDQVCLLVEQSILEPAEMHLGLIPDISERIRENKNELITALKDVKSVVDNYSAVKSNWGKEPLCENIYLLIDPVNGLVTSIQSVIKESGNIFDELFQFLNGLNIDQALEKKAAKIIDAALDLIKQVVFYSELQKLTDIPDDQEPWNFLRQFANRLQEKQNGLNTQFIKTLKKTTKDQIDNLDEQFKNISKKNDLRGKLKEFKKLRQNIGVISQSYQNLYTVPLSSLALSLTSVSDDFFKITNDLTQPVVNTLFEAHKSVIAVVERIIDLMEQSILSPIFEQSIKDLKSKLGAVKSDRDKLQKIKDLDPENEPKEKIVKLVDFFEDFSKIPDVPLFELVDYIANTVGNIAKENFHALIDRHIEELIDGLKEEYLDKLLLTFIPTSYTQEFSWETKLKNFPSDDPIFFITITDENEDKKHLKIKSLVSVDFKDGGITTDIKGELLPFNILLLPNYPFATLKFQGLTFESQNGSSPSFDVKFDSVELGENAKFFQQLQDWLTTDSGFYLDLSSKEIEAGYLIDLGIISFAAFTFLNVSIGARIILPFDGSEASFGLNCGTKQKPIGISFAPAYGGVGYIDILADAKGVKNILVSLAFGALVGFQFGPVKGQGRVVTGISLHAFRDKKNPNEDLELVLGGFFEAVGSASVACFSLSIFIRIMLIHSTKSGNMGGEVYVKYKLKVGLFSISISFTARKDLDPEKGDVQMRKVDINGIATKQKFDQDLVGSFVNEVPNKKTDWQNYQHKFSFDFQ